MSDMVLSGVQAAALLGEIDRALDAARPKCRYRGCGNPGRYFMRRRMRRGVVQQGLYCEACEVRFGNQNLKIAEVEL